MRARELRSLPWKGCREELGSTLSRMTALRYQKTERRPFSSARDSVEIYPDLHHWDAIHGDSGTTVSDAPLDELAFIYFLRTVTLAPDSLYSFDRHYDKRRLGTTVRIVKHETPFNTPLGSFNTVEYEMNSGRCPQLRNERDVLFLWIQRRPLPPADSHREHHARPRRRHHDASNGDHSQLSLRREQIKACASREVRRPLRESSRFRR